MFVGLDPTCFDKKGTACALLDSEGHFVELASRHTNDDIIDFVRQSKPRIVAIDSPLGFPKGRTMGTSSGGPTVSVPLLAYRYAVYAATRASRKS